VKIPLQKSTKDEVGGKNGKYGSYKAPREFKSLPGIFMFCSWLSVGIAVVNKESF